MKKKICMYLCSMITMVVMTITLPLTAIASGPPTLENATAQDVYDAYFSDFASLDATTITVNDDVSLGEIWINGITEDITIDLNGHMLTSAYIDISGSPERTLTIKDSIGTGKISGDGCFSPLNIGGVHLIIDGGTYIGTEDYGDYDMYDSFSALNLYDSVNAEILSGKFYGADGKINTFFGEDYCPYGSSAVEIQTYDPELGIITATEIVQLYIGKDVILQGGNSINDADAGSGLTIYGEFTGNAIEIDGAALIGGNGKIGGNAIYSEFPVKVNVKNGAKLLGGNANGKALNLADESEFEITDDCTVTDGASENEAKPDTDNTIEDEQSSQQENTLSGTQSPIPDNTQPSTNPNKDTQTDNTASPTTGYSDIPVTATIFVLISSFMILATFAVVIIYRIKRIGKHSR